MPAPQRETRARSLAKSLSWRLIATLTTAVLSLLLTGELEHALSIGGLDFVVKLVVFYLHERMWQFLPLLALLYRDAWKLASWKLLAVLMTTVTSFYVTGSLSTAFKIGPSDFTTKLLLYWLFDRAWGLVSWGTEKPDGSVLRGKAD